MMRFHIIRYDGYGNKSLFVKTVARKRFLEKSLAIKCIKLGHSFVRLAECDSSTTNDQPLLIAR